MFGVNDRRRDGALVLVLTFWGGWILRDGAPWWLIIPLLAINICFVGLLHLDTQSIKNRDQLLEFYRMSYDQLFKASMDMAEEEQPSITTHD